MIFGPSTSGGSLLVSPSFEWRWVLLMYRAASTVGTVGMDLGNGTLGPYDLVFPCPATLPIWSSVGPSTRASVQAKSCSSVPRALSDVCWWTTVGEPRSSTSRQVSVDNIGVQTTSPSPKKASELMGKSTTTFDDAGLLTHDVSISESQGVSLG